MCEGIGRVCGGNPGSRNRSNFGGGKPTNVRQAWSNKKGWGKKPSLLYLHVIPAEVGNKHYHHHSCGSKVGLSPTRHIADKSFACCLGPHTHVTPDGVTQEEGGRETPQREEKNGTEPLSSPVSYFCRSDWD